MKITTPFNALRNATSDILIMHDFNYKSPEEESKIPGKKECIDHPTSSHCKIY